MPKPYLTPEELCDLLPVGRSQIYKLLKTGEIPRKRIGKKYIVPREAFEKWLASCDTDVSPAAWGNPGQRQFLETATAR